MEPKLTLRIANSDLLPVQGRYAELLNAPDMDGVLTAWRGKEWAKEAKKKKK